MYISKCIENNLEEYQIVNDSYFWSAPTQRMEDFPFYFIPILIFKIF